MKTARSRTDVDGTVSRPPSGICYFVFLYCNGILQRRKSEGEVEKRSECKKWKNKKAITTIQQSSKASEPFQVVRCMCACWVSGVKTECATMLQIYFTKGCLLIQAELKQLCRQGFPVQYRAEIWRRLIYSRVADIRTEKGDFYYSHLVTRSHDSPTPVSNVLPLLSFNWLSFLTFISIFAIKHF